MTDRSSTRRNRPPRKLRTIDECAELWQVSSGGKSNRGRCAYTGSAVWFGFPTTTPTTSSTAIKTTERVSYAAV